VYGAFFLDISVFYIVIGDYAWAKKNN